MTTLKKLISLLDFIENNHVKSFYHSGNYGYVEELENDEYSWLEEIFKLAKESIKQKLKEELDK